MADKKTLKVVQTGSPIGRTDDQLATLKGLGLNSALEFNDKLLGLMQRQNA